MPHPEINKNGAPPFYYLTFWQVKKIIKLIIIACHIPLCSWERKRQNEIFLKCDAGMKVKERKIP